MTNPSLATMIHEAQRAEEDARAVGMRDYAPDKWVTITSRLYALRRLASLCRRACGLARAGDSVVLVAPAGTSPDEVAGGLADEGAGREHVEVLTPSAEEWPAVYAAARQRKDAEVVS